MSQDIWYFDTETFAYDNLFVFKRQSDGQVEHFWNDPDSVQDFCSLLKPVLCGFNTSHYDNYILKAALLGWAPEQIKLVNDTIIESDDWQHVWALFQGSPWVNLPPTIDLWPDITPRQGLKALEAMMGMAVVESSVPFDIDRPLTAEERDEVLRYCLHDVDAVAKLYDLRFNYLKSKTDLCEMRGVDPLTMLKHTNARIVSEVLEAQKLPFEVTHERRDDKPVAYEIPDNIDLTAIPAEVLHFATSIHTYNCEGNTDEIEFMFHGCPTKVALGGIHAAVPKYKETASDERVILLQDIGSYYPSLIINNGYMSRAVADPSVYKQFYDMRMDAKARGDKATADAAKLVLNTTYGTMKDAYNKMYDPMQATRVCLSGQLYIIDLIEQVFRVTSTVQLIQLNTDGWVISLPRDKVQYVESVLNLWSQRTGFTVDTTEVETIVQRDVNNYVLRKTDGTIKAKGGTVACFDGPDLFYRMPQIVRNNNTIIDKAVVDYLLDGTPIEDTINACDDIERFQIIAKAGRTFQKVVHQIAKNLHVLDEWDETPTQRVNRVYATTNEYDGGIFKVKLDENGKEVGRSKIPLTPEHCFIDNEGNWRQIELTTLDRSWYVSLAKRKAKEFVTREKKERDQMAGTPEPNNQLEQPAQEVREDEAGNQLPQEKPKPTRRTAKKADTPPTEPVDETPSFRERLRQLQVSMAEASKGVEFNKVVEKIGHEYADTQQYKVWLSQKTAALGLTFGLSIERTEFLGIINPDAASGKMYGVLVDGEVVILDAFSDESISYGISGFGVNTTAGYALGGAQTNALRNFILNCYLLDNMGRDGDDVGMSAGTDPKAYVSPEGKAAIKQGIVDEKSEKDSYATDLFAKALYEKIQEVRAIPGQEDFAQKQLDEHFNEDGTPKLRPDGKSTMKKTDAVKGLTRAEEIIAENEKAAA